MATFTKAQLKRIIKEEYEAVMNDEPVTEGNEVSRMITKLEKIGKELIQVDHMVTDVAVSERLEMIDEWVTELWKEMHDLLGEGMQEEITHSDIGAHRGPQEVFDDANKNLHEAHKDLQMLSLHLKNGGFDVQPTEDVLKAVEQALFALDDLPKQDVEKLLSLKGPLKKGTRD